MSIGATVTGIPTTYRATLFRSRLEARWAALFDLLSWDWVYEPLDADGYIPDFVITGERPLFVEVGPCITERDYRDKARKADAAVADIRADLLVVGVTPHGRYSAGWLGELFPVDEGEGWMFPSFAWAWANWSTCGACSRIAFHRSLASRPCGHYDAGDGGRYRGEPPDMASLWSEAGNRVQWQPRRR